MKKSLLIILTLLLTSFLAFTDQRGEEIAFKTHNLKEPDDMTGNTKMVLIDKNSNKQVRILKMYSQKTEYGTNSFSEFMEPADVKGTKFLTISEKNGDETQRLYLPALKKVRRISSSNKDGKFMGSDFCYYDMEDHNYEDFKYQFMSENEKIAVKGFEGMKFFIVKFIPKDPDSPYSYLLNWINMDNYFVYKSIPHDKKGSPEKTILIFDVQKLSGVLMAGKTLVINHKESHKTLLQIENIRLNTGLKKNLFEVQNLK